MSRNLASKVERFDISRLPYYQSGPDGAIAFLEENVKFQIPQPNSSVPKWVYPSQFPDKINPETGKSWKQFWDKQKEVIREALAMKDGKLKHKVIVLCWPRGEGKCQAKGSLVLMFDGTLKKVEDVKVGDQLMGDDNTPRNVLSLVNGKEEMFEVIPMKGDSLTVTGDHLLSLKKRRGRVQRQGVRKRDREVGSIIDISLKDYLKESNNFKSKHLLYKVPIDWSEQPVPIDPYFLGVWLGDGHSHIPSITTMDKEIVNCVHQMAESMNMEVHRLVKRKKGERIRNKAFTYNIVGIDQRTTNNKNKMNPLLNILRENNLINNKHIPQVYKANSREVRLQILAGLIDTDGNKNRDHSFQITLKNKRLMDDVLFIARSLGFHAEVREFKDRTYNNTYYRAGITGDCSKIPVRIPRKKCLPRSNWKEVLVTGIKEVKSIGEAEYYGFNLDGNHRYVTGDFTVTHNSFVVVLIQLWKFFCFPRQLIVFGALSKEQTRFVHYDITQSLILNSPKLRDVIGKNNVQKGLLFFRDPGTNEVVSSIRPISSYSGIVSNITGYTFSEMFDMKDHKFFVQLDGSTRNITNSLGTIDSTVSRKDHILYRLYKAYKEGSDKLLYFNYRSALNADPSEFWNPQMDKAQLNAYRHRFPPAEFDMYFRNVWELDSGKLFPEALVRSIFYYGWKDPKNGIIKPDDGIVIEKCNEIGELNVKYDNVDGRKNPEGKRIRERGGVANRKEMILNKIGSISDCLVPMDTIYRLEDLGSPLHASITDLLRLGEVYNTDWSIHAGIDRSDPMAKNPRARTIVTVVAKGLTNSKNSPNILQEHREVPEYIYFLLHLHWVQDATLEGIKQVLRLAHMEYDGLDSICAERWGTWDLAPWCLENLIQFEPISPTYELQKKAFTELYTIIRNSRFKSPSIVVPGVIHSNILWEELNTFDYHPMSKWYGSPTKNEENGIQDDAVYSLAWTIYGGREYGVDEFKPRQLSKFFGAFVPGPKRITREYEEQYKMMSEDRK